jgi:hypothetical protein
MVVRRTWKVVDGSFRFVIWYNRHTLTDYLPFGPEFTAEGRLANYGTTCAFEGDIAMKKTRALSAFALCLLVTSGCGESQPPEQQKPASVFDYAAQAPTDSSVPVQPAAPPAPTTEQVKAEAGVGKKGRGYGGGLITEPVHQYFIIQDRVVFEIELPKTMDLYKASHDFKGPKTHEAFMKEIIEANSIKLPELPEGHRYVYDPKTETLMVERPADGNQTEN